MLVSTYVFMRFDQKCPEYRSREDYYRAAARDTILTAGDLYRLMSDTKYWNFVSYYLLLCPRRENTFDNVMEKTDDGSYICHLTGYLTEERNRIFRMNIESFYEKHGDAYVVYDFSTVAWIDMDGISIFEDLRASEKRFLLKNLSADCLVLFVVEGFEAYLDENDKLREIDLSSCEKINEGANGIIYRLSDEVVAKTFKDDPDYWDEKKLILFMRNMFGKEILEKADRCDRVLPEKYKGRARELIEAVDEPECLVHGDIHPKNVMVSSDEMLFIDFDSFSTGKSVNDLGSLYRALLCNENKGITDINGFFNISFDECQRIWDIFISEYLKDEKEEIAQKKVMEAKLIGTVLTLAKLIKNSASPELISGWGNELERCIDIM